MTGGPAEDDLIWARGLTLRRAGRTILDNVDLAVAAGELVTLIGPNGCGKTSLIRILLGLTRTDSGSVGRRPGLRVGYMPQRINLDPVLPLSVSRFLRLGAKGVQDVAASLAEVGAENLAEVPVTAISGGELQRVLLARALLRRPDLLVLDEPVQGVDVAGQGELYDLIAGLRSERGCGVLMVSHDLHLVMAATDRVVCLNRHVCCSGPPGAVIRDPEFRALFGEEGADSLAIYAHDHDHTHDSRGRVLSLPGQPEPDPHG